MPHGINQVTVIGSGTMGAAIAGQLANAGVPVILLDMAPTELTGPEQAAGLTLAHPKVKNRIVQGGFERMTKAKPASLFNAAAASRITLGNLTDDFDQAVKKSDWIIEVIIEKAEPKQQLMARIEATARPDALITSNTSGIPIHIISQGRSAAFKTRFMGTHFFNPPRYLHLLEIIPTPESAPAQIARMKAFGERVLGKGVVICKDTPNFVANRIFSFSQSELMEFAMENGYTVEEVDRLTGELIGRPKTGAFRLSDVVGNDVAALVNANLYEMITHDADREILRAPRMSAVMQTLLDNKLLGNKTGQGFYKTVPGPKGSKDFWGLDLVAAQQGKVEYLEPKKPRWASVGSARDLPLAERLRLLCNADDRAGEIIWHTLAQTMAYATRHIPEITDSLLDLDHATEWGFGWQLGPFATWDVLGVAETLARMSGEGIEVAPWVQAMLQAGNTSFYKHEGATTLVYSPLSQRYEAVVSGELELPLSTIQRTSRPVAENESASLHSMGDGVLLLEFHSKLNTFDADIFKLIGLAVEKLHGNAAGLVIGNHGGNFSAGANLMLLGVAAQTGAWQEVENMIKFGQDMFMALRRAPKPVVAAPYNLALGGGAEVAMTADRMIAHAELYMGLPELGVGLIPGWGGCKELVRRNVSPHVVGTNVNPTPYLRQIFEVVGFAKISTSAAEARDNGFLAKEDRIILNADHLLAEAKREVLRMAASGYVPPVTTGNVYAAGRDVFASMQVETYSLRIAGYISEYDAKLANRLARILCGGDLSAPQWMDEQYFLDLERAEILSAAGEAKSQERIWYMLQNGKPLRN